MNSMLKQAQKMQEDMARIQQENEESEFTASAGGGMVEVTVTGKHQVTSIQLKPEVVDPEDIDMLGDLLIAAVNEAMRKADETLESELAKVSGGLGGLNIPGLF